MAETTARSGKAATIPAKAVWSAVGEVWVSTEKARYASYRSDGSLFAIQPFDRKREWDGEAVWRHPDGTIAYWDRPQTRPEVVRCPPDSGRISAISDNRARDSRMLRRHRVCTLEVACRHACTSPRLVTMRLLGYPGGMVSHYTARVTRGQIVIRDIDLPDGTAVSVTVKRGIEELRVSPVVAAQLRESFAQLARGETISGEESIADLQRHRAVRDSAQRERTEVGQGSRRSVGGKSRKRVESSRRRAR